MNLAHLLGNNLLIATCRFVASTFARPPSRQAMQPSSAPVSLFDNPTYCRAESQIRPQNKGTMVLPPTAMRPISTRPLRVRHVMDSASPRTSGRLVISGRMADVCAELDRLAAREAALH